MRAITIAVALTVSLILGASAATSAESAEPLPTEVAGCFAEHADKNPVRLGEETMGLDFVCMSYEERVPCVRVAGHYAWWFSEPRTPTQETLASGVPLLMASNPDGSLAPNPCPPEPEPTEEPTPSEEPTTEPTVESESLAAPANVKVKPVTDSLARTVTKRVKVTYSRVAQADLYIAKCGTHKVTTSKVNAKLKARKGAACKVRAHGDHGMSPWSKAVRVR
jgi:hypothetical protein